MNRGKLVAIGIGIVVAVAVGVGLAISAQSEENKQGDTTQTTEPRHFEIELKENVGVSDKPGSP